MYTSIVVPLDGSPFGKRALPVALAVARRSDAAVHLVHVQEPIRHSGAAPNYDTRSEYDARETVRAELIELAAQLSLDTQLRVDALFLYGPVVPALEQVLLNGAHDLVVMMTHGGGGSSGAWLGNVADGLVRSAPVPLLLVRPGAEWPSDVMEPLFCHVLVPLDGSIDSDEVLDHAVALNTPDATVYTLLAVVVPLPSLGDVTLPFDVVAKQASIAARSDAAQAHLNAMAQELRESGALVETRVVLNALPAHGILSAADDQHVDSIALSTQGRSVSSRLVLGSVAGEVIRRARVPVLVFRPAGIHAASTGAATDGSREVSSAY